VEGRPACMDPHILAVPLRATRTSHDTYHGRRSPQVPQLASSAIVTEPFYRPFLSSLYGCKIPIEIKKKVWEFETLQKQRRNA
jgi:hypothetical protein